MVCHDLLVVALVSLYFFYLFFIRKHCRDVDLVATERKLPITDNGCCRQDTLKTPGDCCSSQDKCSSGASKDHVVVLYGSQTGTAVAFSKSLRKSMLQAGIKCSLKDPATLDKDDLVRWSKDDRLLVVFIVATYGDGQPTDNFVALWTELISDESDSSKELFSGLNFCVFGLGDRSYPTFNNVGRLLDRKLQNLGGTRFFQFVAGDASQNINKMFLSWKNKLVKKFCGSFPEIIDQNLCNDVHRDFSLKILENVPSESLFVGEPHSCGSFRIQKRPFVPNNPFLATEKKIVSLGRQDSDNERSCVHLELDITDSKLKYSPGDHVGIYPENDDESINTLIELLDTHPDLIIDLVPNDLSQKRLFPCPCTLYTALKYYLDINHIVTREFLMDLIPFTLAKKDRDFLRSLVNPLDTSMYDSWVVNDGRNVVAVLQDIPMARPPFDLILENLPRLNCRYYSVASSLQVTPDEIHLTIGLHHWVSGGRRLEGVCSKYIRSRKPGDRISMFIRKNHIFHMPPKSINPIVMIASGTGIAPFMGFLSHRQDHLLNKRDKGQKTGNMMIFYGCRSRENGLWYEKELENFEKAGVLSHKFIVASDEQNDRTYVADEIKKCNTLIWLTIQLSGVFYICGGKKNFVSEILDAFCYVVRIGGGMDEEAASVFVSEMKNEKRILFDVWVE